MILNHKVNKNTNKIYTVLFIINFLKIFGFGNGVLKKTLFKFLKYFIGNDEIFYNYHGKKFFLNPLKNSTDSKMIISSRFLEKDELKYLRNINKNSNSVFLDIGANTGYYSIMAADFGFKKIYAFEPIAETIEKLQQNILINKLSQKIEIIPKAVGDKNEKKIIYADLENIGNSSMVIKGKNIRKSQIDVVTLATFINEKKIKDINSIKIDIEGYEDKALFPFLNNLVKAQLPKLIILEHSNYQLWSTDLIGFLHLKGYELVNKSRGNSIFQI